MEQQVQQKVVASRLSLAFFKNIMGQIKTKLLEL